MQLQRAPKCQLQCLFLCSLKVGLKEPQESFQPGGNMVDAFIERDMREKTGDQFTRGRGCCNGQPVVPRLY